jgi:hypothetical protein
VRFAVLALVLSGCVIDELTATHVSPGGTLTATLGTGPEHTCTAIVDATADPITINGFSAALTFGLVGATDAAGANVHGEVAKAPAMLTIQIAPGGANQLELHADGGGCAAHQAIVNLRLDGSDRMQGDFQVTSGADTSTGAACQFSGTLLNIPVSR